MDGCKYVECVYSVLLYFIVGNHVIRKCNWKSELDVG